MLRLPIPDSTNRRYGAKHVASIAKKTSLLSVAFLLAFFVTVSFALALRLGLATLQAHFHFLSSRLCFLSDAFNRCLLINFVAGLGVARQSHKAKRNEPGKDHSFTKHGSLLLIFGRLGPALVNQRC